MTNAIADEARDRIRQAVEEGGAALDLVIERLTDLDDEAVRAPSPLPGWSRGHVLAHIEGVGNAYARQVEFAARGELVEPYDGGAEGRNARIEQGSTRSPAEHRDVLEAVRDRVGAAWPAPGAAGWTAPVTYRDGTVEDIALGWWREMGIHAVDLDVGVGPDAWSPALCRHLLEFLHERLPDAGTTVVPDDGPGADTAGTPAGELVVRGSLRDLAAWLAGRTPFRQPRATRGDATVDLPELGPWPGAPRPAGR